LLRIKSQWRKLLRRPFSDMSVVLCLEARDISVGDLWSFTTIDFFGAAPDASSMSAIAAD